MPAVLRHEGPRPYWYIRYRRKVLVGKNQIDRKEVWHTLGSCDTITKRQAQRVRDEVMREVNREVNREVYTIQSQILFAAGVLLRGLRLAHLPPSEHHRSAGGRGYSFRGHGAGRTLAPVDDRRVHHCRFRATRAGGPKVAGETSIASAAGNLGSELKNCAGIVRDKRGSKRARIGLSC
jgi:hypothetical protein